MTRAMIRPTQLDAKMSPVYSSRVSSLNQIFEGPVFIMDDLSELKLYSSFINYVALSKQKKNTLV